MVLYRPLSADRLRNGIKSALGLRNEGEDARESGAHPSASRRLSGARAWIRPWLSLPISAPAAPPCMWDARTFSLHSNHRVFPAGEKDNLAAAVELIWRDVQGRMGIRFANMSQAFGDGCRSGRRLKPPSAGVRRRRLSRNGYLTFARPMWRLGHISR